jgi:uncharacterized protein
MAHPHEELIRRGDEAFERGDLDAFWDSLSDDAVLHAAGVSSIAGDYRGKEAIQGAFGRYMAALGDDPEIETHAILADDEHGVQLQKVRARKGDRSIEIETVNIMHFRGGKISEFWTVDMDQSAADAFYDA